MSKANGAGLFGEVLSAPIIAKPGVGYTPTFIAIGKFQTQEEADNTAKYIKTKFARAMLGILKTTQDLTPEKWKYVPIQDFTMNSDIDWNKAITDIDRQLYAKYNLTQEEIDFIESMIRPMDLAGGDE